MLLKLRLPKTVNHETKQNIFSKQELLLLQLKTFELAFSETQKHKTFAKLEEL